MFKSVNGGKLPTRGSKYSACVDLYANADVIIGAGETKLIPLGVCLDIEATIKKYVKIQIMLDGISEVEDIVIDRYINDFKLKNFLQLMLRSSLSKELIIANGVGIIDMDYKDEIMIRLHNPFTKTSILHTISSFIEKGMNLFGTKQEYEVKENILLTEKSNGYMIQKGDRVAQITLLEHKSYLFGIESEEERQGGFGSTGK